MYKRIIIINLIGFLVFIIPTHSLQSQDASHLLTNFYALQNNNRILLKWTLHEGATCNDIYIERSTDSIHFEKIGVIAGTCGSPEFEITYSYEDTTAVSHLVNYYRLELGFNGYSQTISLRFDDFSEQPYYLTENPMINNSTLYFRNPNHENIELKIIDVNGRIHFETSTTGNNFSLSRSDLSQGYYIFVAFRKSKRLFTGKILVLE